MSFKNSNQRKSVHQLNFRHDEDGSIFIEVLFTFVAQLFLSLGVIIFFTQIARADVLSFQEWKKLKVDEAQVQTQVQAAPTVEAKPVKAGKSPKLEASKLALEIAQELTIDDYFALYLSQFKDKSDFDDAAKKLSPTEMGSLLLTLKNNLDKSNSGSSTQNLSYSPLTAPETQLKK